MYIHSTEYSQNLILPRKDGGSPAQRSSPVPDRKDQPDAPSTKPAARQSASSVGYRIPTSRLKMTETFKTSIEDLYHTLTSQEVRVRVLYREQSRGAECPLSGPNFSFIAPSSAVMACLQSNAHTW